MILRQFNDTVSSAGITNIRLYEEKLINREWIGIRIRRVMVLTFRRVDSCSDSRWVRINQYSICALQIRTKILFRVNKAHDGFATSPYRL